MGLVVLVFVAAITFFTWFFELDSTSPGSWAYTRREHQDRVRFVSETWRMFPRSTNEWPYTELRPIRIRMVDDLLAENDFKGWNGKKILTLLGPKTETPYFGDWDLVYYLGPGRYGNAVGDSEWLVLRLDSTGVVEEYRVVHD